MGDKCYKVYMHVTPNGKKYIGITKQSLKKRFDNGRGYKECLIFKHAVAKYGWENIKHELIADNLTKEDAVKMEVDLIEKHKTTDRRYGYNYSPGGNIPIITDEWRRKQSQSRMGHEVSAETREKLSKILKGRTYSAETLKRMSEGQKGKKHTPEQIEKIRKANTGKKRTPEQIERANQRKYKKVDMYDLDGSYIKTFDTITEACEFSGAKAGNVSKCFSGQRNSCAGYIWKLHDGEPEKKVKSNYRNKNKPVISIDKNGNMVHEFESTKEAGRQLNLNAANISKCCKNKRWTAGGYLWRFKEECDVDTGIFA